MIFTRNFAELSKNNANIAGGKGASLGEMTNAGIPVPSGFVIISTSFDCFLKESHLIEEIDSILDSVNHNEIHTIELASEKIQSLILNAEIPEDIKNEIETSFKILDTQYVAVRSSATAEDGVDHAWAGQLNSYLNTTKDDLLEKVKHCWASLFTPRAIFYRFEKGLHKTHISVAVVVQKMVDSEISGIAFSVHPVTEDKNQLIIEAGFGLGEAIVSGEITPDSYVVEKNPRNILNVTTNTQTKALYKGEKGGTAWKDIAEPQASSQVLTTDQILELSELVLKIENHYGFPCDIEWAYEKGKFYITQSRPITTLSNSKTTDSFEIDISKFQLLFQFPNMPFLTHNHFIENYKMLDGLCFYAYDKWYSYIPKAVSLKTLKEGMELFSDDKSFSNYENLFKDYINSSEIYFKEVLDMVDFTKTEVIQFFKYTEQLHSFYIKTEFFYTDDFYLKSLEDKSLSEKVKLLGEIKNIGREYLNKVFLEHDSYLSQILFKLSEKFTIPIDDLLQYSMSEITNLFDGTFQEKTILDNRRESYITRALNGELFSISGKEALRYVEHFLSESNTSHVELKGSVANKGKVTARARVMNYGFGDFLKLKELINEMEDGEILVAETTSPEIISACKKASAILTNQGGLMAHAAIVSRELHIPCIVGLGNATEVIKTGDNLEVDANAGTVRILK